MDKLEKLKSIGCNVDEGLNRCLNNQDFYLRLLIKAMDDNKIETLKNAILNNNLKEAFEISHSLKGVYANLALTPIYNIIYELTEYLRKEDAQKPISERTTRQVENACGYLVYTLKKSENVFKQDAFVIPLKKRNLG